MPYQQQYEVLAMVLYIFESENRKEISGRSSLTIIIIQALKYIGKDNIRKEDIERLSKVLRDKDREVILRESINTTSWIRKVIREVLDEKSSKTQ